MMPSPARTIAVFDFDDTLAKGDSFFPFLTLLAGKTKVALCLFYALISYYLQPTYNRTEMRTFVKDRMIKGLVKGKNVAEITSVAEKMHAEQTWLRPQLDALMGHHDKGHHIVIASGGLALYLPTLLRDIPHNALICTDIAVTDGIVMGEMTNGNCVRQCKADRVREYMQQNGGFDDSWGYGNAPHDLPMLQLMQHKTVV